MEGLAGYGMIGSWPGQGEALGNLLRDHGLNYTSLELCAGVPGSIEGVETIRTAASDGETLREFVEAMRERGIVTQIILLNANGPEQMALAESTSLFQDWLDFIEELGPELLLILAIAEPADTEFQRGLIQACQEQLGDAGFTIVGNGFGGRGDDPITEGWTYIEHHWCEPWDAGSVRPAPEFINNTDCSPMLNLTPSQTEELACSALSVGAYFLIYELGHEEARPDIIAAIGGCIPEEGLEVPAIIGQGEGVNRFQSGII